MKANVMAVVTAFSNPKFDNFQSKRIFSNRIEKATGVRMLVYDYFS
jgi:hypothetical protein